MRMPERRNSWNRKLGGFGNGQDEESRTTKQSSKQGKLAEPYPKPCEE